MEEESAFAFEGNWRDFARIAIPNLLLTIVTLGIYRFWATTRERRYLWGNSYFIDDRLEWTGTGKELFFGFLLVFALLGVPFLFLQFGAQALVLQGKAELAGILSLLAFLVIFYLGGVARFRALRYRLSRTYWHGIRGGSDNQGFGYGLSTMWKTVVGWFPFGLLIPWSMVSLWNERWSKMSFGPHQISSHASAAPLIPRFLIFYAAPFLIAILAGAAAVTGGAFLGPLRLYSEAPAVVTVLMFMVVMLCVYLLVGLIALAYYSAFFREAVGGLSFGGLDFSFEARTSDWVNLIIVDALIVVGTFGLGYIFLSYRHWKFFITHMEARGEIQLDMLTQSRTRQPGQGEGLLDAFDVGAF